MAAAERTDFIDRLRVVLTGLVVLHHTAITYGGSGGWFYREFSDPSTASSLLLTVFCAVNQSFFMGMFFLLAGYFTPASLSRKGERAFVRDRLVRLGLPLLVFGFVLGPLTVALAGVPASRAVVDAWVGLLARGTFVIGPLWFAWAPTIVTTSPAPTLKSPRKEITLNWLLAPATKRVPLKEPPLATPLMVPLSVLMTMLTAAAGQAAASPANGAAIGRRRHGRGDRARRVGRCTELQSSSKAALWEAPRTPFPLPQVHFSATP